MISVVVIRLLKLAQQGDASACDQLIGHYAIHVNFQEWSTSELDKGLISTLRRLVVDFRFISGSNLIFLDVFWS